MQGVEITTSFWVDSTNGDRKQKLFVHKTMIKCKFKLMS